MKISEKKIEKDLKYFEGLSDEQQERLANKLLDEQAYLTTFVQQNLDNLFDEGEEIVDFTYNLYYTLLFLIRNNLKKYRVIEKPDLEAVLAREDIRHSQEALGDFIFTQLVARGYTGDDVKKAAGLLNVVVKCFDEN